LRLKGQHIGRKPKLHQGLLIVATGRNIGLGLLQEVLQVV
jgi:hypothetical protein